MRHVLILLLLFLLAFPTLAQSDDLTSYEFETGTSLDYPEDWEFELLDGILSLTGNNQAQILVVDYPLVNTLSQDGLALSIVDAVEILTNVLLDTTIERDEIYEFKLNDRDAAAYDFSFALSGRVIAIEFSNGAVGMMVTIEVEEDLETQILESFDNSQAIVDDVSLPTGRNSTARDVPSVFLFQTNQRFMIPAGWELDVRQRNEIQYAIVTAPDDDVTVQLFDLSAVITKGTELEDVLDLAEIDWEDDFGFEINSDASAYQFSDREAISYEIEVNGTDGILIVLRFEDDAIGIAVIFGDDIADYETEINQLVGSFNNLGAVLQFMQ